jgi:hypothetical protein
MCIQRKFCSKSFFAFDLLSFVGDAYMYVQKTFFNAVPYSAYVFLPLLPTALKSL